MLIKILKMILYFFIIFAKPVYADEFESNPDAVSNRYYQTVAFAVDGYPNIKNILYDREDFMSGDTDSILNGMGLDEYLDFNYTRRIPMVADQVYAPPGTQVDIVYLYGNNTGHNVNISQIDLVLSRGQKTNGNLAEILDILPMKEMNLNYIYSSRPLVRSGVYKEYNGLGTVYNGQWGSYILERVEIKNPINIEDVQAERSTNGDVDIKIYLQNESNEYLSDIKFTYGKHEENFNFPPEDEHVVSFTVQNPPTDLGTFSVYNPNTKQICAVMGTDYYNYFSTDAVSVFAQRNEGMVPGATVQPARESSCIKRIPYTMVSDPIVAHSSSENEEMESEQVLGIDDQNLSNKLLTLPKTGKNIALFIPLLVVGGLLWYSVCILRKKL